MATIQSPFPREGDGPSAMHRSAVASEKSIGHHLKFAQPRALGRKVSDEFTVPLCQDHHLDLRRYGNEIAWWANLQIAPTEVARDLWQTTLRDADLSLVRKALQPPGAQGNHAADPGQRES